VLTSHNAEYHARNAANMAERQELGDNLRQAVLSVRLIQLGVPRDELARTLGSKFDLNTLKVGPAGESEEHGQTFALAYFSSFLLYMTLLMYGMIVMRSVVEEKTSRVAEVVLSSADPFSMLMGKIFGITGAGLTQYAVWAGFLGVAGAYFAAATYAAAGKTFLSEITVGYVVWLIVFFVLGLILYASLYAAIGAIVSSDQEAQQSQLPVTLLVIVALILALKLMNDPSSTSAIVLSEVPFFAPILMPTRIAIAAPPLWQIALSIVLCAATMVLLVKTSAKINRLGLLMTGKRPTLPELVRWLRYA
jgi:ABC-2 type transport system permease protein